jgi:DNA repair exonuclease SbcCD ATPase subunit
MEFLISILVSVFVGFLIMEAYAWGPRISEWLVERAVRRLPIEEQERCRAEWKADLASLPNSAVQVVWALGCFRAAIQGNLMIFQEKLDQIDDLIGELAKKHLINKQKMQPLKADLESQNERMGGLKHALNNLNSLATSVGAGGSPVVNASMERLAESCGEYVEAMTMALNRSHELIDMKAQELNAKLNRADALVQKIVEKHSRLINLYGAADWAPTYDFFDRAIAT